MNSTESAPASEQPDGLVRVEVEGPVMWVSLNRPEAMNAITLPLLDELARVLREVETYPSVRVVALTGLGRAFSAGVDLKVLIDRDLDGGRIGDDFDGVAAQINWLLQSMPVVTIAAVNGACFTGALEIALACDLMVTADEAVLGDTHAKWALRPTWGMTQRLGRAVGPARARLLSFTARTFTGIEAVEMGMSVQHVPVDQLRATVQVLGEEIATNSAEAIAAYKQLYSVADNSLLDDGLHMERMLDFEVTGATQRLQGFIDRSRGVK